MPRKLSRRPPVPRKSSVGAGLRRKMAAEEPQQKPEPLGGDADGNGAPPGPPPRDPNRPQRPAPAERGRRRREGGPGWGLGTPPCRPL